MHYHCEVVIPPIPGAPVSTPPNVIASTEERAVVPSCSAPAGLVEAVIASILRPYCEHNDDRDEDGESTRSPHAFWDWYVIGGRWAGAKLEAALDPTKLEAFRAWLHAEHITVSGVIAGKQEISPAHQIPKVDAKWREMFPESGMKQCPLFEHAADQYGKGLDGALPMDICRLADVPKDFSACRVIFAHPAWNPKTKERDGAPEVGWMIVDSAWNGCNHMKIEWDGKLASAVEMYRGEMERYRDDYRKRIEPTGDWLAVTVDYHS